MSAFLMLGGIFVLCTLIAGVYSVVFDPEVIDEEETKNIQRRHGRPSRAYLEDFSTRKKSPSYYMRP
jgi:hypothetical protein